MQILPVILSGGSGTRLWPVSRQLLPKQLHALTGQRTLLQQTVSRVSGHSRLLPPVVICNEDHRFLIAEQLREIDAEDATIVLEPAGRNTAPAAIIAALIGAARQALVLILPSDQLLEQQSEFLASVTAAAETANAGHLVTFGVVPHRAETGFGYIKSGIPIGAKTRKVDRFVEKPDEAAAKVLVGDGRHLWNCGMLLFDPELFLSEAESLEPEMLQQCRSALDAAQTDMHFLRLDRTAYEAIKGQSVDYAILERTDRAAVMPIDVTWSDVGSWAALWEVGQKNEKETMTVGDVVAIDASRSYLHGDGILVAAVGVSDLVVVATKDAVLVSPMSQSQRVREITAELTRRNRDEAISPRRVYRPWGWYEIVDQGNGFLAKRLMVSPKGRLSLQMHHHRSEHWVVVQGVAEVQRGNDAIILRENESTFIPAGMQHRLANPGVEPLYVIEVQSGSKLSEDDIVRFEDNYGRVVAEADGQ